MKTKYLLLSLVAALFVSCNLEEKPTSFVNHLSFYKNETQCRAALNSCYIPLNSIFTANFMMAVEGCTDIWYCTSSTVDAILDVTPAKPQMGKNVWTQAYKGVMYCNECVDCISAADIDETAKMSMVAEAVVMRAFYYYILTCFFGDVPFYTERVDCIETQERLRRLPRMSAYDTRQTLYDQIDMHQQYLEQVRANEVKENRAGAAFGYMLMAKFAMWNEDFESALIPLHKLEEIYGELTEERYPWEKNMWRYKNVDESIFELQHEWSNTGVKYNGNVACIMMPRHEGDGIFNGVYFSEYGTSIPGWNSLRGNNYYGIFRPANNGKKEETASTQEGGLFNPLPLTYDDELWKDQNRYYTKIDLDALNTFEIRGKKVDRRVVYKLGLGNLETGDTFTLVRQYGVVWPGPQFWCPDIVNTADGNNYHLFRYADAVLMLSECYCQLENDVESMRYLNMIKARAGIDLYTSFSGFEDLTVEIRNERAKELGGEFQRKFDLVRWGIWYEQTYNYTNYTRLKEKMRPCHRYYPIPDTQCALSGGVLTNDEYKAAGL